MGHSLKILVPLDTQVVKDPKAIVPQAMLCLPVWDHQYFRVLFMKAHLSSRKQSKIHSRLFDSMKEGHTSGEKQVERRKKRAWGRRKELTPHWARWLEGDMTTKESCLCCRGHAAGLKRSLTFQTESTVRAATGLVCSGNPALGPYIPATPLWPMLPKHVMCSSHFHAACSSFWLIL